MGGGCGCAYLCDLPASSRPLNSRLSLARETRVRVLSCLLVCANVALRIAAWVRVCERVCGCTSMPLGL